VRRNVLLGGVIAAVVVAAGLGWFFGSRIRSPAEAAADAEPPEASNITVQVVSEVLSADVITRGDIVYDEPLSVSLSGSFAETPEKLVVTRAVEVDAELAEGDVAVEVVGRPVFFLTGEIPMYRDLRPGATGDDVLQVEEALARMGFLGITPDNVWNQDTGAAVAAWYQDAGYRPNGLSEEDEVALRAARDRVTGPRERWQTPNRRSATQMPVPDRLPSPEPKPRSMRQRTLSRWPNSTQIGQIRSPRMR